MSEVTVEKPQLQRKLIDPIKRRATFVLGPHGMVGDVVLYDDKEAVVIPVRSASVQMRARDITTVTLEIHVMGFDTELNDGQVDALYNS